MSRGAASVSWTQCLDGSSSASAIQVVPASPSNAAYGRCSGNWAICGEYGASTDVAAPEYEATVCADEPRANGSSSAASGERGTDAGSVHPYDCRGRDATNARRRFESVTTTSPPPAATRRISSAERSPAYSSGRPRPSPPSEARSPTPDALPSTTVAGEAASTRTSPRAAGGS